MNKFDFARQSGMKIIVTGETVYDRIRAQQESMKKEVVAVEF